MAQLSFSGLDELMLSMKEVANIPDSVIEEMLNAGADALIPEIKARGEGYGVGSSAQATGILLKSISKSKVKKNQKHGRYITIYFKGSRVRGHKSGIKNAGRINSIKDLAMPGPEKRIKNNEIAFLVNYGTRKQPARPFFTDALEMSERTIFREQSAIFNKWLESKGL